MNNKIFTLWLTGLPCCGKTTISNTIIQDKIFSNIIQLDGDIVRKYLSSDLDYTMKAREENVRRVSSLCKLLNLQGFSCIVSILSPLEKHRIIAKSIIGEYLKLVYINTPLDVCEKRDVKGMYNMARQGKITNFTGIDSSYEVPQNPDIVINTTKDSIDNSCRKIISSIDLS
jgi:adenylyl-sulfate kinase